MKFVLYNPIAQTYMGRLESPSEGPDPLHVQLDKAYQFETEEDAKNYLHEALLFNHNFYIITAIEIAEVMNA